MAERFEVRQGDPIARTIEVRDLAGRLQAGVYDGTEGLFARLWPGDDRAAIVPSPTVAWSDAAGALIDLDYAGEDTAALDRGVYKIEVLIAGDPKWSAELEVLAAPGGAGELLAYATYDGMLRVAGKWITELKDEASQASFVEERHDALVWTHRQLMSRARSLLADRDRGYYGNAEAGAILTVTADIEDATTDGRLEWLEGRLDAMALITTPTLIDANEHYAVGVVLGRVMGAKDDSDRYVRQAGHHMRRANALLSSVVFRVASGDSDGTVLTLGPR